MFLFYKPPTMLVAGLGVTNPTKTSSVWQMVFRLPVHHSPTCTQTACACCIVCCPTRDFPESQSSYASYALHKAVYELCGANRCSRALWVKSGAIKWLCCTTMKKTARWVTNNSLLTCCYNQIVYPCVSATVHNEMIRVDCLCISGWWSYSTPTLSLLQWAARCS